MTDPLLADWPFDQSPNCAVIALRQILDGTSPVLHVTHDADDDGWQFLTLDDVKMEDAVIVCFSDIIERDPSLTELADLPPGWRAWRESVTHPWIREEKPEEGCGGEEIEQ
jgi:hypothetical protein